LLPDARIDRRRRGLDHQQSNIQLQVGTLLAADWYNAVETCEGLLDQTTETLGELKDVLIGETGDLLNLLAEIESLAGNAGADGAADAAREAQLKVDGIAAWGRARHEAWSEYFGTVQRFIRDHVRMDPDRAVSRRLQDAITGWPDMPWTLAVAEARSYLHLRRPDVDRPHVIVRQSSRNRESEPEFVDSADWETALATSVSEWLRTHPDTTLSDALRALLPRDQRFRFAGRITRALAQLGVVTSDRERSWVPVDHELEVEQWVIRWRQEP